MNSYSVIVVSTVLLCFIGCGRGPAPVRESASVQPGGNYVPAGTQLKVRTAQMISMRGVAPGDRIEAELAEPLEVEGKTKVPAGAKVIVSVVDAKPALQSGANSKLLLKVTQLRRSILDQVELNTAGLQREGPDIQSGSVLTFSLASPAQLETPK